MYAAVYFYRVPASKQEQFVTLQRKAAEIYEQHGALSDWTFEADDLAAAYGCRSFDDEIETDDEEVLYFSISQFESEEHHDEVMAAVDEDPTIHELYEEISGIIDVDRAVRGEFNRVV